MEYKNQITYERDVHKSYMKIPAIAESNFDEKRMLQGKLEGILPCQKCYINQNGEYWYDISGKQALDSFCKVKEVGLDFLESLLLGICQEMEHLEWNLIEGNCLVLNPEMIFLNSSQEEFFFVLYPDSKVDFFKSLQGLMEYLLTKLNHQEKKGVERAYGIYEILLQEGYKLEDIKNYILKQRIEDIVIPEGNKVIETTEREENETEERKLDRETLEIEEKLIGLFQRAKTLLYQKIREWKHEKKGLREEIPEVVYPEEEWETPEIEIHPTICISSPFGKPQGRLIYQGIDGYSDYEIGKHLCIVGKSPTLEFQIPRDTISQFHAKIEYLHDNYYIEDMNSTNGTFVNEEILNYKERRGLEVGDVIRFADVKYRFL